MVYIQIPFAESREGWELSEQEPLKLDLRIEICLDDVAAFSLWGLEMNCRSKFLTHGHVYVNAQKSLHIGFVAICMNIQWYTSFVESREGWDTERTRAIETSSKDGDLFR